MALTRRHFVQTGALAGALGMPFVARRAAAAEPIKVGSLLDLSGPIGSAGQPMNLAIKLAVDDCNARGGLLGRKIELVSYDTQSNIQLYSQYAQQLVLKDKVDVVHAGITSASREAIRPVFDRYKTLYFYNTQYEGGVCDRDCFCTGTTPAQTVEKLVPYAMKNYGKKAYIVAADYNYGQITAKWMKKFTLDAGGSMAGIEFFPLDVTNFAASISKIQEARPDVVMCALVGSNHTGFFRQWTAAGMHTKIPLISTTFGLANELATLDRAETEGIVTCYGYYEELATPASKAFAGAIRSKYPGSYYIGELSAATYEGFFLWAAGVEKAGSVERMKTIEGLETGVSFDGPSGKVTVDHATHHLIRNTYLAKAVDRKWQVLETFPAQPPADTAAVCDLIKNPNTNKMFVIDVKT
jgi:branched-chain amino acid transport system substrate-binding protein